MTQETTPDEKASTATRPAEQALASALRTAFGVVRVVMIVVLVALVFSNTRFLQQNQRAVILRFGKRAGISSPGLHAKLPFGIDQVLPVPVEETKVEEFGFRTAQAGRKTLYAPKSEETEQQALILTGDLNYARVEWVVRYRAADPAKYLFNVSPAEVSPPFTLRDTLRDVSESVMRRMVGDRSVDEVITIGREELAQEARAEMQKMLDSFNCGINVTGVELQAATPPDEVKDAFDGVNRALQQKDRLINQAQAKRNELLPRARGDAQKQIKEATAYRDRLIKEITGKIAAFSAKLEEYEKAPEVTRRRMYLEAMEKVLARCGRKTIVDDELKGMVPLLHLEANGKGGGR